ncbi:MAG: hypothetical protein H6672_17050 [Anaerolineaceae bacterium]|nr:hypothetical protein [Anaerolineaceae bacterium]
MGRKRLFLLVSLALVVMAGIAWAAPPAQQIDDFNSFVRNVRADLELLADEVFSGGRPDGWTSNDDSRNLAKFVADLWFDNELLANAVFNNERQDGWIGAPSTSNAVIVARNVRHDLELTADAFWGFDNRRNEWHGSAPRFRCSRSLQNLVTLLADVNNVNFQSPETAFNYCSLVSQEAEDQVLRIALSTPEVEQETPGLILAVRGDLERLADEKLGLNTRPAGWRGNRDPNSPTLASDIFLDLDTLANDLLGQNQRPDTWIGIIPNAAYFAYRNLRHDLELLANAVGQVPRPRGWQGLDPILICDPTVQDLVLMAAFNYSFSREGIPEGASYCQQVSQAANQLVENPPVSETAGEQESRYRAKSRLAFSYLDPAATQYMGVMPYDIEFQAWYRNYGDSTMMFVSGQDFAVFIDRRWTTMDENVFRSLPTIEGVRPLTFCDATWCNGPGPTPTPTGSGAIELLLNANTPPAPVNPADVSAQKQQVSWNNIRVTYLLDNTANDTAQVTLEICKTTSQTDCEPVTLVFDNNLNAAKPVLSQFNGLNVYEFGYGYTDNLIIEGATLFSPDVWISDPTIR